MTEEEIKKIAEELYERNRMEMPGGYDSHGFEIPVFDQLIETDPDDAQIISAWVATAKKAIEILSAATA